jgi:CubicO group peptidase (beta-lactamase class C family)
MGILFKSFFSILLKAFNRRMPRNSPILTLRLAIATIVALSSTVRGRAATCVQTQDSLEAHIDLLLKDHMGTNRPGAVVGIIQNGKLVFQKGYGMADLERQAPNGPTRIYKAPALSKQFTAAAMVHLAQQKKISLDDRLQKYIPEFPAYGKNITINHLIYHTSGIRDYLVLMWISGKNLEETFTNKEVLKTIVRQESLDFEPGQRCVYSHSNYVLLAEILERVTGSTLSLYSARHVFGPLGMPASGFDDEPRVLRNKPLALGYKKPGVRYLPYRDRKQAVGDRGLYTMLSDLVVWDQIFYDTLSAGLGRALLQRGELTDGTAVPYGKGIIRSHYRGLPVHTHPGTFLGYGADMLRFPTKQTTIICLTNTDAIDPEKLTQDIADVYVFGERPTTTAPGANAVDEASGGMTPSSAVVGGEALREFTGTYYSREQQATYSFFIEGGALWFVVGTNPKMKVVLWKKYERISFPYYGQENVTIDFQRNSLGRVDGFILSAPRATNLKFIKQ